MTPMDRRDIEGENRMYRRCLFAVLLLALAAASSQAQTLIYEHDGTPLFSITYPSAWLVDLDFEEEAREAGTYQEGEELALRIVEARPNDDRHLWFGVWAIPDAGTLGEGLAYLSSLQQDLFTGLELSEARTTELGGMSARVLQGTARREGEPVELLMALFEPRRGAIAAALYVGEPEAWQIHRQELEAMVASLKAAAE